MNKSNTLFLTGLRGYSALAVFVIHSGGAGLREVGDWGAKLVDFGKYGVISFFVLSALTLAISIDRSKSFSYPHYLSRRFARIFPMYALAVIMLWAMGGASYYQEMFSVLPHDLFDLVSHLTFINVWDNQYQNTIIGVEWTVPIEMWTYLVIPSLFVLLTRAGTPWKWGAFFVAILISVNCWRWHKGVIGYHWAIENYLYCFIGGILAFCYRDKIKLSERTADGLVAGVLILIIALALHRSDYIEQWLTILVMVLVLSLGQSRYGRVPFENRLIVLLGNISFPFYLLHFPVLHYFKLHHLSPLSLFIAGIVSTSILAYLCHKLIEQPALKLTGRLHPYDR